MVAKDDSDELTDDEAIEAEEGAEPVATEEAEVDWKAEENDGEDADDEDGALATAVEAEEPAPDDDTEDGEYAEEDASDDEEEIGTETTEGCAGLLLIVVKMVGNCPPCDNKIESWSLVMSVLVLLAAVTSDVSSPTRTVQGAAEYQCKTPKPSKEIRFSFIGVIGCQ